PTGTDTAFVALTARATPPLARIIIWSLAVEVTSALVESPQTNEPVFTALARLPAAKEVEPAAVLLFPPGTVAWLPDAVFDCPPPTVAPLPLPVFDCPPPMATLELLAVLPTPPAIVDCPPLTVTVLL